MSKSGDDRLRSAWAKQTDQSLDVDLANAEANVRRRRAEIARRDRRVYVSAAVIGPSWLAATWFMPDLRLASVTGLFIAVWLTWQMYRRSGARLLSTSVDENLVQQSFAHDCKRRLPAMRQRRNGGPSLNQSCGRRLTSLFLRLRRLDVEHHAVCFDPQRVALASRSGRRRRGC